MGELTKKTVFERGDKVYIVSPVAPFDPDAAQIEEFAFSKELMSQAPNPAIKWLKGEYVEADKANKNGQIWAEGEVEIKSLTPQFMPVTVMHDRRSAVGVIADTRLLTPEKDAVPRAKIDNTLAIWSHRFPEIAEEIDENYRGGTLMQSMECHSPAYSCAECGQMFHKLPEAAERANWCHHLQEAAGVGARILQNVVFTGTGLIFGTRGKEGANPNGHLDVFQDEVAEFHEEVHHEAGRAGNKKKRQKSKRRKTSMGEIEINSEEFAELKARPTKDELAAATKRAEEAESEVAELKPKVEEAESAQKKAEEAKDEAEKKLKTAEEEKAEITLRDDRFGKLGDGFVAKLGETTKENLKADAGKMEDEAWEKRITEVEELAGVKRDAKADGKKKDPAKKKKEGEESAAAEGEEEFSIEELASSSAGGSADEGDLPSANQRQSVARGLLGSKKTEKSA